METQIGDGFKLMSKEFTDYKSEVKDERIKKLTDQIEKGKDKNDYLKNGVIITLIGGTLLYVAVEVLKNLSVNPPSGNSIEKLQKR